MLPLPLNTAEVPLGPVVEVILALIGILGGGATWKWFFGDRKRSRVDNAQVVNDMAVKTVKELLAPITKQAETLRTSLEACERRADELERHLEQVVGYAILAHLGWGTGAVEPTIPHILQQRLDKSR